MTVLRCSGCGGCLLPDQRYCIECGRRHSDPLEAVDVATPARVLPAVRRRPGLLWGGAGLATALLVGTALGPVVTGGAAGTGRASEIVVPGGTAPAAAPGSLTAAPTSAVAALQAPTGNSASVPAGDGGGGGGTASVDSGSSVSPAAAAPSLPAETGPTVPAVPKPEDQPTETDDSVALSGTVVHLVPAAHSYVLATAPGQLIAVHADSLPAIGKQVKLKAKPLANGTFEQAKKPAAGADKRDVTLLGSVTFVDVANHAYTLSSRGSSLLVHAPADAEPPALAAQLTVKATLDDAGHLQQTSAEAGDPATGAVDHEAPVQAIDQAAPTLTLAADDTRESGQDIVVHVPATIDVSKLRVGDMLDSTFTIAADGSYTLTGYSHDGSAKAAADGSQAAGDQRRR